MDSVGLDIISLIVLINMQINFCKHSTLLMLIFGEIIE